MKQYRCAIATPHHTATEAAESAVRNGGNAIDAALAAAAVLTVVYPHQCSIGGDMFALVGLPGGKLTAIDASGPAAAGTDPEEIARRHEDMPLVGIETVTVPGVLAGWDAVASLGSVHGSAGYTEGAAAWARDGIPVAPSLAEAIEWDREMILSDPGLRQVFTRDGELLQEGGSLVQPELATSLETIATEGSDAFYRGSLGVRFIDGIRSIGSPLTGADLSGFRPVESAPLCGRFGGCNVITSPPPSQGFVLLEMLKAAELSGSRDLLGADADLLAWIARLASDDRDRFLADPSRARVPLGDLLSDDHIEDLLRRAREPDRRGPVMPGAPRRSGDTVAVTAVDSDGRAVSLIQSVFHSFGAGILEPSTGIICHNRGACFTLDPDSPNRIEPGKRPAHTLMPVLVRDSAGRLSAFGTMGGRAQPQIHAQMLLRRLAGLNAQDTVSAPRFVVGGLDAGSESDVIFAEADLTPETSGALDRTGFEVRREGVFDEIVGHTTIATNGVTGLNAASDPRADGSAKVIERSEPA